jgi:hypothetical protein
MPKKTLSFFPPQLVLNPHESRAVRVQYLGKTEGVEKAYRLVAEQLPVHLHDTPAAGSFPLVLGLNQENSHSFYWTINASPVVTAGASRFQDTTLQLRLYSGLILGATVLEDTKTITFRAKAESSIDLSLVNTGGAFNIADTTQTVDFGTLASGESLEYDTMIRSNDGYVVTLQSQNSQQLKHAVLPAGLVPYSLTVNGGNVNLSGGNAVQAATATGATPATGNRLPTIFTIGTLTGAEPAGNYQDVITVTVSSH